MWHLAIGDEIMQHFDRLWGVQPHRTGHRCWHDIGRQHPHIEILQILLIQRLAVDQTDEIQKPLVAQLEPCLVKVLHLQYFRQAILATAMSIT